jgi:histidinol phosphatase-like enzyme
MTSRPKTIFLDIDGTLLKHHGNQHDIFNNEPEILPGVIDKLKEWDSQGYNIILVTGRRKSTRKLTEQQLDKLGIFYDELIMGIGGGQRVLINDLKPNSDENTAISVCVNRNEGFKNLKI